ncbi:calcium-binding protein [Falsiroseomonas selenitidurans]|uniref:Calcium-binding protein n=1 Tax=Falsiroseomonas selenitidurans TaxID=2716335 RepID=A0ABX1DY93_9PROT|nr:calcium-binding protein [Falsiroseomonas selenitidurans]NKC29340.1 calcium-binding protein [Falsiroseomonas selenitidurans]
MSGFASISGGSGDDLLVSSAVGGQADLIRGEGGNDTIYGLGGEDTLVGGPGQDVIYGGLGADLLRGNGGADELFGGLGTDTLIGGGGADTMDGGGGADSFEFNDGFGHDLIVGFQLGTDTLQIASNINATGVADPNDLLPLVSADGFGNAVITLGGDTITLQGISVTDLTNNIGSIVQVV